MSRGLPFLLFLAACGSAGGGGEAASGDDRVECAVDGDAQFRRACEVERTVGGEGLVLTLRSPSGGFRRLLVTRDGRGVVAADGAEPALVKVLDQGRIEVSIGGDRYRLPATVR